MTDTVQRTQKRPTATVIYAEVNRTNESSKRSNIDKTRYRPTSHSETDEGQRLVSASSQTCEEDITSLQRNSDKEKAGSHQLITENPQSSSCSKGLVAKNALHNSNENVSHFTSPQDTSMQHSHSDSKLSASHYEEVDQYEVIEQDIFETTKIKEKTQNNLGVSDTKMSSNHSKPNYSSAERSSSGDHTVKVGMKGISYVDFMPQERKESCCKSNYLNFRDCMKKANNWLELNKRAEVCRCETVRHRLNHFHNFDPESMVADDRSYLLGLRVWFKLAEKEKQNAIELEYRNFIPQHLEQEKLKSFHSMDRPYFEDFSTTTERMNKKLMKEPIRGKIIDIETVPVNLKMIHNSGVSIDFDACYCPWSQQGEWEIFMIRLFYIVDPSSHSCPKLACIDFVPDHFSLPPSNPQFQTMSGLIKNSNEWLEKNPTRKLLAINIVDFSFKMSMLVASKGYFNTNISMCKPAKSSANRQTLKVLRLWVSENQESQTETCAFNFDQITFAPQQFTASGCCGANKPIFSSNREVVEKINSWINSSGAEIVDIQTDNIEKWQKSSLSVHSILPERTYNKEDFSSSMRSALEYRITVIRVYYTPKNLSHFYSPNPDNPIKPCCCFVGCNLM